jgi:hypothetical protein
MRTIEILKPTALLIVLSFLIGCASVSPTYLDSTVSTSIAGTHVVSVERGKHFGIDNVPLVVFMDGKEVALLGGGQAISLNVKDGRHIIGVAPKTVAEHGAVSSIAIDVSSESQPILRTNVAAWGWAGWMIERVY